MNFDDIFPKNYISAPDLGATSRVIIIDNVTMEEMKDGKKKPAITMRGKDKKWILNKTTGAVLANAFGKDTNGWIGQRVEIYAETVTGPNGLTQGIRCRPASAPRPAAAQPPRLVAAEEPPFNDGLDDIGGEPDFA